MANKSEQPDTLELDYVILHQSTKYIFVELASLALGFILLLSLVGWFFDSVRTAIGGTVFDFLDSPTAMLVVGLIGYLILAVVIVYHWYTRYYELHKNHFVFHEGFLRHRRREVDVRSFRALQIDQNAIGRLIDYGTITLDFRDPTQANEQLTNIDNPNFFRKQIERMVFETTSTGF